MKKRTKDLDIAKAVKDTVWERDGHRCILCLSPEAMPNAHYIPRSQGGLGIEENVVTLCQRCHNLYDNSPHRPFLHMEIQAYLRAIYNGWTEERLTYKKGREDV